MTKKKKISKSKFRQHFSQVLDIASDLSILLVSIRGRPKPSDYFAIGLKLSNIVSKTYDYIEKNKNLPISKFLYENKCFEIDAKLMELVESRFSEVEKIEGYMDGTDIFLFRALLNNEEIFFYGARKRFYTRKENYDNVLLAVGTSIWETIDTNFLSFRNGAFEREKAPNNILEFSISKNLFERVKNYSDKGINRSFLIEGIPGSGKSTATKFVANKLGYKTLFVDFSIFNTWKFDSAEIECLQPEVLIIDDLDRVESYYRNVPMNLIEKWNKIFKVIFVTVNNSEELSSALMRPGRIDEHIQMNYIEENEIRKILEGKNLELAQRFKEWPVAFIYEFIKRRDALGEEMALKELDAIEKRFKKEKSPLENKPNGQNGHVVANGIV